MRNIPAVRIAKLRDLAMRLKEVNKAELDYDYPGRGELIEAWNKDCLEAISYANSRFYEDIADAIYLLEMGYYEEK